VLGPWVNRRGPDPTSCSRHSDHRQLLTVYPVTALLVSRGSATGSYPGRHETLATMSRRATTVGPIAMIVGLGGGDERLAESLDINGAASPGVEGLAQGPARRMVAVDMEVRGGNWRRGPPVVPAKGRGVNWSPGTRWAC